MANFQVYLHNVPKVTEDDKVVPIAPPQTQEFAELGEAQKFAADHKGKFDRVVLMGLEGDKQRLIERYMDGEHTVIERKKAEEPEAEEAAEKESEPEEGAN